MEKISKLEIKSVMISSIVTGKHASVDSIDHISFKDGKKEFDLDFGLREIDLEQMVLALEKKVGMEIDIPITDEMYIVGAFVDAMYDAINIVPEGQEKSSVEDEEETK